MTEQRSKKAELQQLISEVTRKNVIYQESTSTGFLTHPEDDNNSEYTYEDTITESPA